MADPELEAIRQRRMQELMAQHGGGGGGGGSQKPEQQKAQEEAKRDADERRQMMLSQVVSSEARERIARIALVKPEKARGVEDVILRTAQMGQIVEKVSEEKLISLLEQINTQTTKQTKVTVEIGPRWKGKSSEAKALADPMSKIMEQLKCSLVKLELCGLLSGCSVLLEVPTDCIEILNRACIGRPIITAEKKKLWFQLGIEEAFYLCQSLKCLPIKDSHDSLMSEGELWKYFVSIKTNFPVYYKAYSHLRAKNWVVRSGLQYGVDFVAYRHHPALVHSEYAVLALSGLHTETNGRLNVWSDILCTVRLAGAVAKTLLVVYVSMNGKDTSRPTCLDSFTTEERTITRWSPEMCRKSPLSVGNGSN